MEPGDVLEFTISAKNIGSDPANNTVLTDTLDSRFIYVPGSMEITYGPNAGVKTDAADADQAEFDATNNVVKAYIGTGATGTTGGTVQNSPSGADSTVLTFQVTLMDDCLAWQCGDTLLNKAFVTGVGDISGNTVSNNGTSDVLDANGCPTTESGVVIVDVDDCPPPIVTYDDSLCVGEELSFSFPASPEVIYTWSGPNGFTSTVNNPIIPSVDLTHSGDYFLNVTFDGMDCLQDTVLPVFVSANPTIQLNQIRHDTCFNLGDGFIDIDGLGNGPFTYAWNNSNTTNNPTNLTAGDYNVTVTDVYGCTVSDTFTLTEPPQIIMNADITSDYNGQDISCFGAADASATVSIYGGVTPYNYSWSPSGATTIGANPLDTGYHVATITDANGCIVKDSVYITQPDSLDLSLAPTAVLCFGGTDGGLDLTVSGGTTPYDYVWAHGPTTQDITNVTTGNYTVTVTDVNGCTKNLSALVDQPVDSMTITFTKVDILCHGDSTGSIDLSVTGGNAPYTFAWNSGQTTEDLTNVPAGIYTVNVTDDHGCVQSITVELIEPNAPLASTHTQVDILCYGDSTGSFDLTVTDGSPGYTYQWNNGPTTEDQSNLPAGTYIVTITDDHNCTLQDTIILTQPDSLELSLTQTDVLCFGLCDRSY